MMNTFSLCLYVLTEDSRFAVMEINEYIVWITTSHQRKEIEPL